ncbi:imidazole glycerol phosphate synthase subunit HisH [Aeromonas veronii]|uniref:imidazole glycerol phosphate synthase subunit HisH n=1 Tax=Aeromonas veronii TaxID=654 RepID=UPI00217EFB5B|nr:imidazole glycerol phosphate synthase subunit HisH [Aeromonas veronii]UWH26751.1 imidazole glycerol phosphate synthase subunit HisH [Aeromonas veronii]
MNNSIGIIDCGVGNIASIANMIKKIGGQSIICKSPADLNGIDKLILPGVGSFDHGMKKLRDGGWIEPLNELVLGKGIPVLGICLGMQLMGTRSDEGKATGLGWVDAEVVSFDRAKISTLKVPHMGWNAINIEKKHPLFSDGNEIEELRYYFVHSYHMSCNVSEDVLATTNYGYKFTCAFATKNIMGVQFHPEKSHRFGMRLFKLFLEL